MFLIGCVKNMDDLKFSEFKRKEIFNEFEFCVGVDGGGGGVVLGGENHFVRLSFG